MELIRGLHNLHPRHRGCVATIGNFDGVHLGHQAVFKQLTAKGVELRLPTVVLSFEPQPQEYFSQGEEVPFRLTRFREKVALLGRYAVDRVLILPFNNSLAKMDAREFVSRILIQGLGIRYLVIGDDFRFGKGRRGNFAMLQEAGRVHGFEVVTMQTVAVKSGRVSSTRIREALACGDLATAGGLLGRPYHICGHVAYGKKLGRTIGFPTANIALRRRATAVRGVFAVELSGTTGESVRGMANVGTRPTVDGDNHLLEVHLFDFSQDIYGQYVCVDFLHRLRDERRFESFEALRQQILVDAQEARAFFAQRG